MRSQARPEPPANYALLRSARQDIWLDSRTRCHAEGPHFQPSHSSLSGGGGWCQKERQRACSKIGRAGRRLRQLTGISDLYGGAQVAGRSTTRGLSRRLWRSRYIIAAQVSGLSFLLGG